MSKSRSVASEIARKSGTRSSSSRDDEIGMSVLRLAARDGRSVRRDRAALLDLALDLGAQRGGLFLDAGQDALALTGRLIADRLDLLLGHRLLARGLTTHLAAELVGLVLGDADDLVGLTLGGRDDLVD